MTSLRPRDAAQYVRMSTDTQNLSPAIQKQAIAEYAACSGWRVVHTYEDDARSGLSLRYRSEMRRLLRDVAADNCPFSVVLVYDVSRWGRFQDTDESAYYEYHCRMHGVEVIYVVEPFGEQQTPMHALLKAVKRSMAAEFSRELAVKVSAAQHSAVTLGYQIGRTPCIGVDRVAVAPDGSRRTLARAERGRKGERIAWVMGPGEEVALVRRIFEEYTASEITLARLSAKLNAEGATARGRPFTLTMVRCLLESEIFYGEFIWGRRKSGARSQRRGEADPAVIRKPGVFTPIVSKQLWEQVQAKRDRTRHVFRPSKQVLLAELRNALQNKPGLTATELRAQGCAPSGKYYQEFGSIREAMRLAGRDEGALQTEYLRRKSSSHRLANRFRRDLASLLTEAGIQWTSRDKEQLFSMRAGIGLRFRLIWRREHRHEPRWFLPKVPPAYCSHMLLVLMEEDETSRELLLMTTEQYRSLRSWFRSAGTVGERRIFSAPELIGHLKFLMERD